MGLVAELYKDIPKMGEHITTLLHDVALEGVKHNMYDDVKHLQRVRGQAWSSGPIYVGQPAKTTTQTKHAT